jgi:hypothetical protein
MPADPPISSEFALLVTPLASAGAPTSGQWARGQMVLDNQFDLYVCTQSSDSVLQNPALWKKLSGGGGGVANYAVENLTSQIDGQTSTFTSGIRVLGTISVFLNGQDYGTPGLLQAGAHIQELSTTSFQIDQTPQIGEELHIRYFTP